MTATIISVADSFTLPANLFELYKGQARLAPHSHLDITHPCDVAAGPFVPPAFPIGNMRTLQPELARDANWFLSNIQASTPASPSGFAAYESMSVASLATANIRLNALSNQANPNQWTIHLWVTADTLTNAKPIASNYAAINGLQKWVLTYTNSTTLILSLFNAAGAQTNCIVNLVPGIVAGDILYLKFGYAFNGVGLTSSAFCYCYLWTEAAFTLLGNNSSNVMPNMPEPELTQDAGLTVFGSWNNAIKVANSVYWTLHSLRRFTMYDDTPVAARPTVPPPIYSTYADGVIVPFDSGENDSTWNPATFFIDDLTVLSWVIGNPGVTLKYECANVLTGVYSAEMTAIDFAALGTLTGRYLSLELIYRSDGFTNYGVRWILCQATDPVVPLSRPHSYVKKAPHSHEVLI